MMIDMIADLLLLGILELGRQDHHHRHHHHHRLRVVVKVLFTI